MPHPKKRRGREEGRCWRPVSCLTAGFGSQEKGGREGSERACRRPEKREKGGGRLVILLSPRGGGKRGKRARPIAWAEKGGEEGSSLAPSLLHCAERGKRGRKSGRTLLISNCGKKKERRAKKPSIIFTAGKGEGNTRADDEGFETPSLKYLLLDLKKKRQRSAGAFEKKKRRRKREEAYLPLS